MFLLFFVFVVVVVFFARGLDEKKYIVHCTYSFTLVNKEFVRSFVLSLSLSLYIVWRGEGRRGHACVHGPFTRLTATPQ